MSNGLSQHNINGNWVDKINMVIPGMTPTDAPATIDGIQQKQVVLADATGAPVDLIDLINGVVAGNVVWGGVGGDIADQTDLNNALSNKVSTSLVGTANGVAGLDSGGKVPSAQLPASIVGSLNYQGTWNANTNSPTLVSSTGTKGFFYKVGTAGATSIDGITQWNVGDIIAFNGTVWDKIDGLANEVVSVAGRTGVVTLTASDVSLGNVNNTSDTTKSQAGNPVGDAIAAKAVKGQTGSLGAYIAAPADGDVLRIRAPRALTVTKTTAKLVSGTCSLTTKINSTSLGTAVSASSTESSQTYSQAYAVGDYIVVTEASSSSPVGLTIEIDYTYTLS